MSGGIFLECGHEDVDIFGGPYSPPLGLSKGLSGYVLHIYAQSKQDTTEEFC